MWRKCKSDIVSAQPGVTELSTLPACGESVQSDTISSKKVYFQQNGKNSSQDERLINLTSEDSINVPPIKRCKRCTGCVECKK